MLLKHNIKICDISETKLLEDPVVTDKLSQISPYVIYIQNKELIDSFATTLVNYSPVSINIADYWNKDILDTTAFVPPEIPETKVKIIQPFEFAEPDNPPYIDPEYGEGFLNFSDIGRPYGGALLDLKKSFEYNTDARVCPNEFEERFFLNPLIGLQDRLAQINLNNFYSTLERSMNDVMIYERMRFILEEYNKEEGLFSNTNELFTEDKFLANRDFVTKKGTALGIKYAGRNAFDAEIQGSDAFYGDYFMNVYEDAPFKYHIESNLLNIVFEKFVKPLAHPIGMDYMYSNICENPTASMPEYPGMTYNYDELTLGIQCLCYIQNLDDELLENQPIPDEPNKVSCVYNTNPNDYPKFKAFASPDGTGLWKPIENDKNIWYDTIEGIETNPNDQLPGKNYYGRRYTKYLFRTAGGNTQNYLIKYYITDSVYNSVEKIDILYYQHKGFDTNNNPVYKLYAYFINQRHCNVAHKGDMTRVSKVDETMYGNCEDTHNGIFQYVCDEEYIDYPNNVPIDLPSTLCGAPGEFHDGFMGTEYGGALSRWSDLYFGWFRFCDKNEDCLDKDSFDEDGLISGFGQGILTMSFVAQNGKRYHSEESPQEARERYKYEQKTYKYLKQYEKEINGY